MTSAFVTEFASTSAFARTKSRGVGRKFGVVAEGERKTDVPGRKLSFSVVIGGVIQLLYIKVWTAKDVFGEGRLRPVRPSLPKL